MMTIRFYGDLNRFLLRGARQRQLGRRYREGAAVGEEIEACGVPSGEVELVLVNGEPSGLGRRLAEGDRISVYPHFEDIDLGPHRGLCKLAR